MSIRSVILAALCLSAISSPAFAAGARCRFAFRMSAGRPYPVRWCEVQTERAIRFRVAQTDACRSPPNCRSKVSGSAHAGFADVVEPVGNDAQLTVVMRVAGVAQKVEVTAARMPLALDASASSVRTMTGEQLQEAPGFTLDDQLRQVAGFQLFRRTSSWVANPTTQGTSLRGLGSTAVSRTLVLSDQVPLNDAFGGWIHWNEIPQLAVRDVELMRGGASDLYGSSAIGGVIDVVPVVPQQFGYAADVSGASEATSTVNGLLTAGGHGWSGLGATTLVPTDGYILTAPAVRGPIDVASNVHSQSGRVEVRSRSGQ